MEWDISDVTVTCHGEENMEIISDLMFEIFGSCAIEHDFEEDPEERFFVLSPG